MKPLTLEEVINAVEGAIDRPMPRGNASRVTIDSRQVQPGDIFIAIRGERFDGHDFVGEAFHRGAVAAMVCGDYQAPRVTATRARYARLSPGAVLIRVDDTVAAMGRLARYYRREVIGGSVTVVAVTGSNGKTTTKTMIAHILAGRWPGRASAKSFNNQIGVPVTLLEAEPSDKFVICEVGTSAPGEIAALARIVEPDIGVVTGVGPAHLERLGSLEGVAVEKMSLLHHLRPDGCGLVNVDYEQLREVLARDRALSDVKVVTFGQWDGANLRLTDLRVEPVVGDDGTRDTYLEFKVNDRFAYRLNVAGRHNAFNALAAIGVARRLGLDHDEIIERMRTFVLPAMRLQFERAGELAIINDAYNANPASMAAAVQVLADTPAPGRRVMIVGDMRELGPASEHLHRQVALAIAETCIDVVIAVGEHARLIGSTVREISAGAIKTHAYATTSLARRRLLTHLRPDDTVLVKGSRAMALEQLVEVMRQWAPAAPVEKPGKRGTPAPGRVSA